MRKRLDPNDFTAAIKDAQRNTVWPEMAKNIFKVDSFLIKGSTNPTMIQRIAALLIGLHLMGLGLFFFAFAISDRAWLPGLLAVVSCGFGVQIFSNGCIARRK